MIFVTRKAMSIEWEEQPVLEIPAFQLVSLLNMMWRLFKKFNKKLDRK
jgi:hypothetical protein